jgi:hypothetical protein
MSLDDVLIEQLTQEQRRQAWRRQEQPHVKIEINCTCGRPLEAATYLQDGLVKLVVAPCLCAERGTE